MKSVECHLHALMCSVSVVTVVFIYTMEDDQRLNTLVHEGDTLHYRCMKPIVLVYSVSCAVSIHCFASINGVCPLVEVQRV